MHRINATFLTRFLARAALTIMLTSAIEAPIHAAEPAPIAMPEPVERASADDCAIIVELGRKKLNWGAAPPKAAFYAEWPREGGGTYLEACPWKALGVAEPVAPAQNRNSSFWIKRPVYQGRTATAATAVYEYAIQPPDGSNRSPFVQRQTCSFAKDGQGWLLMECKTDFIT